MNLQPILVSSLVLLIASSRVEPQALKAQPSNLIRQSQPASGAQKKAEERFKNIQVLKGIPAEQVFPTMQFITASLGVECDFCHVQNAFDKDDKKPKQAARKMMEMMFAINKDNFDGHRQVTCNTCHRGSIHPAPIPAVMTAESTSSAEPHRVGAEEKPEQAKDNPGPSAEQLLDKYVQAAGGAVAIEHVSSRIMQGTIDFGGKSFAIDIYAKNPEKRISFTHMTDGDSITAFDGHDGWLGTPGHPIREMQGSDLDGAAIDADLHLATHLKQMFTGMRKQPSEKIAGRDAYVVTGEREGNTPIRLYFDEQTGLLVRLVRFGETALGWLPTQIDYADYREAEGVKVPYRWTLARPSGQFTIQLTDLKQNVAVDDAKFAKPANTVEPRKNSAN